MTIMKTLEKKLLDHVSRLMPLPNPEKITNGERRNIIARYAAALEPNFIAWMTAAHIASNSAVAQEITEANLREELQNNHPGMLRRFAKAADALPTSEDFVAIEKAVQEIRENISRLNGVDLLMMMGFFESFIAEFMPFLSKLAALRGSKEFEYTDVHGAIDGAHADSLVRAVQAELTLGGYDNGIHDGMFKIRKLISAIIGEKREEWLQMQLRIRNIVSDPIERKKTAKDFIYTFEHLGLSEKAAMELCEKLFILLDSDDDLISIEAAG